MASNPEDVIARLTDYLASGGLFNPELAQHDLVSELIRDARDVLMTLTAAQATPPASPEPPDRTREAFRAGFLAVCKRKGDTEPLDILARVWSFDGVAAADLEPEAYEAWRSVSPVPVAPQEAQAEVLASLEAIVDDMEARWDMDDPSTNPGIRDNVKRAHAAIRAVRRSVSPAAEER